MSCLYWGHFSATIEVLEVSIDWVVGVRVKESHQLCPLTLARQKSDI